MPLTILSLIKLSAQHLSAISEVAPDAQVVCTSRANPDFAAQLAAADILLGAVKIAARAQAPRLKWMQLPQAGAAGWVDTPREITITTGAGVYGIPIAEHVFAMMLALTRGIDDAVRAMPLAAWRRRGRQLELHQSTCAVIGLGDIGHEVARRASAFGMRVLAMKRTPGEKPQYIDELFGPDGLETILPRADHIVLALPGTAHTRHLISAERLRLLKPTAFLYNVGRGSIIDEQALVEALQHHRLAGAGLDVFETEPLPAESPLWRMENVIITPHRSGSSARRDERLLRLFVENLGRFLAGKPMRNEFRHEWGY